MRSWRNFGSRSDGSIPGSQTSTNQAKTKAMVITKMHQIRRPENCLKIDLLMSMKGFLAVHCIRNPKSFDWNLYVLDILFFCKILKPPCLNFLPRSPIQISYILLIQGQNDKTSIMPIVLVKSGLRA